MALWLDLALHSRVVHGARIEGAANGTTRRQLAELRTEMTQMRTEASQTRLQIAELSSGVTQMRGQMDEMTVVLQGISAQAYLIRHRGTGSNNR